MSAPYTGGLDPRGPQFAVDGNFYSCDPCSPPRISYPFKGDSVFSNRDVIVFNEAAGIYGAIPLGTFPNIQPWSANQRCFIIEQDFMVAMEAYVPLPLNLPYFDGWAIGWQGFIDVTGYPLLGLSSAIFVEEDPLEDMGQGIVKVRRRFAVPPPTRNEIEQFNFHYPGFNNSNGFRKAFEWVVPSRIQYDYFIFDDYGILPYQPFPYGPILNAQTGLYPDGLIMEQQFYYAPVQNAVNMALFLDEPVVLTDPIGGVTATGSIPSATFWQNWIQGINTSNGLIPEIIAEFSCMRRWMGNIWERRTRFVQVQ